MLSNKTIHIKSECNHVSLYIVWKKNIVTLQSKNKNKAFKAEVKFTKLKMKINKNKSTELC